MPEPHADPRPRLSVCPLCAYTQLDYQFTDRDTAIVRCAGCALLMRNPQPSDADLAAIYSEHYFLGSAGDQTGSAVETNRLKRATAASQLDEIEARLDRDAERGRGRRLIEVGAGLGNLLVEAASRGYEVTGVDSSPSAVRAANAQLGEARALCGSLATLDLPPATFDVAVMADVIEHTRDPLSELTRLGELLKPGGLLFIAVPSLDSWSARLMKERWMEFKLEHLFFFDSQTIRSLLFRAGYADVSIVRGWKTLSTEYVIQHFERFPVPVISPLARAMRAIVPGRLRRRHLNIVASGIDVVARRTVAPPPATRSCVLSVIMPVFNEQRTFRQIFDQVYNKTIPGVEIELIVVESNSGDGSRALVQAIEGRPRVTVMYEDRPRGKGHAVRAGLARARGDIVLIQDADLEYDVNDYDQLVAPIVAGRAAFVLGVRHDRGVGVWKRRHFTDSTPVRIAMKVGHAVFRTLFNVVYGQRLRDPFTMFKVFRKDCLYGLTLESNRFDFDWELVGKLVRVGYAPLELAVNYSSRSFAEGKKVSLWRDPFTYIRACFKYRFQRLYGGS